jgi:hypothetical protein
MTQAELDALPETKGPVYQGPKDIFFVRDLRGDCWMTDWVGDTQYKVRVKDPRG